jgi:hypothetical protein
MTMLVILLLSCELRAQGTIQIITSSLVGGVVGSSYSAQVFVATGGTSPYNWFVQSGSIPPGLTLSTSGVLTGTPATAGTYNFVIAVSDSAAQPQTATKTFTITITSALSITSSTLPGGAVGTAYTAAALAVTGGTPPYSWSGSIDPSSGLSVSGDGFVTGTPAASGTFNVSLLVTDSSFPQQTASKTLTVTIQPKLSITTTSPLPAAVVGVFYTQQMSSTGPTSVTWSAIAGTVPPGLTLANNGTHEATLSGTPTVAGTFDFTAQVSSTDSSQTLSQAFHIVVNAALSITTNATLPDAALGAPYSVTLQASGGVAPYTWTTQVRLPAGLTLSSSGVISGTPIGLGTVTFGVQVADSFNPQQTANRTFSITVASALSITTTTLPSALQNSAYTQQLQNTGGTSPYTWLVTRGSLPPGLQMTTGGLLQGTPTLIESQNFDVTVTDSRGVSSTKTFTLAVDPPISNLSAPSIPATATATQQLPLAMSLDAPRPSVLSGQLTLTFASKAEVPVDDPMTQLSNGTRTVKFTIAANSRDAVFTSPVMLLIGTVAGTVRLTASIDNGPSALQVATIEVSPSAPQVTNLQVQTTAQGADLIITGYSTPRRVTGIDFVFVVKSGSKTSTVTLSRNVDAQFTGWYQNAASVAFGSAFSYTQSVSVQNGTIQTVTVILKNAQGSTSSAAVQPH